jgi:hypothetical protein
VNAQSLGGILFVIFLILAILWLVGVRVSVG